MRKYLTFNGPAEKKWWLENARQDHQRLQHRISHTMCSAKTTSTSTTVSATPCTLPSQHHQHLQHRISHTVYSVPSAGPGLLDMDTRSYFLPPPQELCFQMPQPQDAASRDLSATLPGSLLSAFPFLPSVDTAVASGLIFSLSVHFHNQSDTIICLNILPCSICFQPPASPEFRQTYPFRT